MTIGISSRNQEPHQKALQRLKPPLLLLLTTVLANVLDGVAQS
jgi:hypothetical protein